MKIKDLANLQALRDKLPQDQKTETNTRIVSKKNIASDEDERAYQEWLSSFGAEYEPREDGVLRRRVVAVKKPAVRGGLGRATLQVVDEDSWQDECGGEYIVNKKGIRVYLESKVSNVSKSARKPDATATVRTKAIVPTNIGRTNPFPLEKLIVYLTAQQAARLQLSYKEIERICGCALPVAVYKNRAWWLTDGDKECSRKWSGYIVT